MFVFEEQIENFMHLRSLLSFLFFPLLDKNSLNNQLKMALKYLDETLI